MCHEPAQINNLARMICDTIYITTSNGPDLFNSFNITYNCKHKFHGIFSELSNNYCNITDRMAPEIRCG